LVHGNFWRGDGVVLFQTSDLSSLDLSGFLSGGFGGSIFFFFVQDRSSGVAGWLALGHRQMNGSSETTIEVTVNLSGYGSGKMTASVWATSDHHYGQARIRQRCVRGE
jgi:hypothetical protein